MQNEAADASRDGPAGGVREWRLMILRRAALALALAAACTAARPAEAQTGSAEASDHYRAGVAYAKSGKWDDAVREFDEAYKLDPTPLRLYDVAQVCLQAKQFVRARDAYARIEGSAALSADQQQRVRAGLATARSNIGRARIVVPDARPTDVVTLDGARVRSDAVDVDPGRHVVRLVRGGDTIAETTIDVAAGSEATATLTPPATPPAPVADRATSTSEDASGGGIPTISWILGGVAVAAIGGGAYLAITGTSEYEDVRASGCAPRCEGRDEAPRRKAIIGDVVIGGGVVSAAVAVVLALTADKPTPPAKRAAWRSIDVGAVPTRTGLLFGVRGGF